MITSPVSPHTVPDPLSPRRNRWEPEVCAGLASILGEPLGETRPCFCLSGLSSRVAPSHKCQGVREPQRPGSLAPFPRAGRRLPDLPSSMEGCEPELGWGRRRLADGEGSWGAAGRACRRGLSTQARRGLATWSPQTPSLISRVCVRLGNPETLAQT